MPLGVSKDFLSLAKRGQQRGLTSLGIVAVLGLLGGFVAEMLDPPRLGAFVVLYGAAILGGTLLGGLLGWQETRSWGNSLKDSWHAWMQSAQGASSMGEAAERAGAWNLTIGGLATGILVVLNGSVLVASWFQLPTFTLTEPLGAYAIITVTLSGLTLGVQLVVRLVEAWWCRSVEKQTLTMVQEGRLGVWGVR